MAKNIADFFGEKKQHKFKCKKYNLSPENLIDDEKIEQRSNSS